MKVSRLLFFITAFLLLVHGAYAQENCPETLGLQKYINCRLGAGAAMAGQEDADKVANPDSLGGSKLDLAKRFFTLLDLGDFKEDLNGITFSFNPDILSTLPMHFNPRVIVHRAEIYEPLAKEIDREDGPIAKELRASLKDSLKGSFGDFDDTELRVVGAWKHQRRANGAAKITESVFNASGLESISSFKFLAKQLNVWVTLIPNLTTDTPLDNLNDDQRTLVKNDIDSFVNQATHEAENLHQSLTANKFYALGMLVANDPQLSFDGSYRLRKGAVGPDEWGATARYEYGLVSYGRYLGWAKGKESVDTLNAYLAAAEPWIRRQPRIAGLLEYSQIDPFSVNRPEDGLVFTLKRIRRLTGKLTYGQVLASNPGSKFDFEARYDDFSDDPKKQNRFVATATWTQKLTDRLAQVAGGTQLVVSAIYANKPEFLGDVNQDWGMRAGLKWSLDDGKKN